MTCYVDALRDYPDAGLRFDSFCHLLADDRDELHRLAAELGVPRRAYTEHAWRWHYDLPAHVRAAAVAAGAREIDRASVVAMMRVRRAAARGEDSAAARSGQSAAARESGTGR